MVLGEDRAIAWRVIDGHNWQLRARHSIMLGPLQEAGNRTNSRSEMYSIYHSKISQRLAAPQRPEKQQHHAGGWKWSRREGVLLGTAWRTEQPERAGLDREMLTSPDRKPRGGLLVQWSFLCNPTNDTRGHLGFGRVRSEHHGEGKLPTQAFQVGEEGESMWVTRSL